MQHVDNTEWGLIIPSHDTRPAANFGATITPAQNAFGSWATVLASGSVTADVYMIDININTIGVSAQGTDSLTEIGVDPAGGTSFTTLIPTLLTSYASAYLANNVCGGINYRFRVKIKSGSTIGARGAINNATVGTQRVSVTLYCLPKGPVKAGSYVVAYGADTSASCGTAVTAGTTSVGTYTQLGSAIADGPKWDWCVAMFPKNNNNMGGTNGLHCDLALGGSTSNNRRIITNQTVQGTASEVQSATIKAAYSIGAPGDLVYTRGWSFDAVTAMSAIAYAVGG